MNRPAPLHAIHPPVPAPVASGALGGMLIAGIFFWIVENVFHDKHHELAALICPVGGVLPFKHIAGLVTGRYFTCSTSPVVDASLGIHMARSTCSACLAFPNVPPLHEVATHGPQPLV